MKTPFIKAYNQVFFSLLLVVASFVVKVIAPEMTVGKMGIKVFCVVAGSYAVFCATRFIYLLIKEAKKRGVRFQ